MGCLGGLRRNEAPQACVPSGKVVVELLHLVGFGHGHAE